MIEELRQAKEILHSVKEELRAEGFKVAEAIPVGVMIETPAAAVSAHFLAQECDFFSIGTNDLVQYTNAADRGSQALTYLQDPLSPSVLRLIGQTITQGHKHGIKVGMCGEMAGIPEAIPLLVGMGMDEFSMAPALLPKAKSVVRNLDAKKAALLWQEVKQLKTAQEIRDYLQASL